MMKLSRSECPNWLTEKVDEWTRRWIQKVNNPDTKNNWDWYDIEGMPTNQCLLPILCFDTKNHCSYCDRRPLRKKEIDHFKSKVLFPEDAFKWENLFLVCKECNFIKLDLSSESLIKPDADYYSFDKYFEFDEHSGDLIPKGEEDSVEYKMADNTIKLLRLNEDGLPEARKIISDNKRSFQNYNIERVSFRFIFT
jgi:uncharacterized protein (TIGR02646 family)